VLLLCFAALYLFFALMSFVGLFDAGCFAACLLCCCNSILFLAVIALLGISVEKRESKMTY